MFMVESCAMDLFLNTTVMGWLKRGHGEGGGKILDMLVGKSDVPEYPDKKSNSVI